MVNTRIKQFNDNLGNYINQEIANGIDIATVVIVLDKYLQSAILAQNQVLEDERKMEEARVQAMKEEQRKAELENDILKEVPDIENFEGEPDPERKF